MRLRWHARLPRFGSDGAPTFVKGETVWQTTWLPELVGKRTITERGAVVPAELARQGIGASSVLLARMSGRKLEGTLTTSISLRQGNGLAASCAISGVRFSLPAS